MSSPVYLLETPANPIALQCSGCRGTSWNPFGRLQRAHCGECVCICSSSPDSHVSSMCLSRRAFLWPRSTIATSQHRMEVKTHDQAGGKQKQPTKLTPFQVQLGRTAAANAKRTPCWCLRLCETLGCLGLNFQKVRRRNSIDHNPSNLPAFPFVLLRLYVTARRNSRC